MQYDKNNIFAKIVRGDIPCQKIYEDDFIIAFDDIYPQATIHVLVIPKQPYLDNYDFNIRASEPEIIGYYRGLNQVINLLNLADSGYRLISNSGYHGGQDVFHFHTHILGGENLTLRGPII